MPRRFVCFAICFLMISSHTNAEVLPRAGTTKMIFEQVKSELPNEMPVKALELTERENKIFVAENGNDITGTGELSSPFATLGRALIKVTELKNSRKTSIGVYLREGRYPVSSTVHMGADHSGVVISSYNSEEAVVTGGVRLLPEHFKLLTDTAILSRVGKMAGENILVADLKALGITSFADPQTRSLIVNGFQAPLSRYPNSSSVQMGAILNNYTADGYFQMRVEDTKPCQWKNTGDIWMYGSFGHEWSKAHIKIADIDAQSQSITTTSNAPYRVRTDPMHKFYYYNVLEELDTPGEWYLDDQNGILYYYPIEDVALSDIEFCVTNVDLIRVNSDDVVIDGITIENGLRYGVTISQSNRCVVQNCIIRNIKGVGVWVDRGAESGVLGCTIYGTGRSGIDIGAEYSQRFDYLSPLMRCGNFAQNNFIYNTQETTILAPIRTSHSVGSVISHNLVSHSAAGGITPTDTYESVIEYNEIVGGPNVMSDMGGIYQTMNGSSLNYYTHIRYNYVHDLSLEQESTGIYLDTFSSFMMVYGNVISNVERALFVHAGRENAVVGNVIADFTGNSTNSLYDCDCYYSDTGEGEIYRWFDGKEPSDPTGFWHSSFTVFSNANFKERYPNVNTWLEKIKEVGALKKVPDYERGPLEDWVRLPMNNHYENNVIAGSVPMEITASAQQTATGLGTNTHYAFGTDPGFIDVANKNYGIAANAQIYSDIPSFEAPAFDRMGLIREYGIWETLPSLTRMECISPKNSGRRTVGFENVPFKWTPSLGANYYYITIAEDEQFSKVVAKQRVTYPGLDISLAIGKKYYWKVEAFSNAKSIADSCAVSEVWSFMVMNEQETAKYYPEMLPMQYVQPQVWGKTTFEDGKLSVTRQDGFLEGDTVSVVDNPLKDGNSSDKVLKVTITNTRGSDGSNDDDYRAIWFRYTGDDEPDKGDKLVHSFKMLVPLPAPTGDTGIWFKELGVADEPPPTYRQIIRSQTDLQCVLGGKNLRDGKWHDIKTVMDFKKESYDVYIDNEKVVTDRAFTNTGVTESDCLRISTAGATAGTGTVYFDDIEAYRIGKEDVLVNSYRVTNGMGGNAEAEIILRNNTDSTQSAYMFFASYNDNQLLWVHCDGETQVEPYNERIIQSISIPRERETTIMKIFVWDKNMKPYEKNRVIAYVES